MLQASQSLGVLQGGEAVHNPDMVTGATEDSDDDDEEDDEEDDESGEENEVAEDGAAAAAAAGSDGDEAPRLVEGAVATQGETTRSEFCSLVDEKRGASPVDDECPEGACGGAEQSGPSGSDDDEDDLSDGGLNNHEFMPHRDRKPRQVSQTIVRPTKANAPLDGATVRQRVKQNLAKKQHKQSSSKQRSKAAGGRRKEGTRQKTVSEDISFF